MNGFLLTMARNVRTGQWNPGHADRAPRPDARCRRAGGLPHEPERSLCHPKPLHGFTIVELLVVISIIALLLSLVLPAIQNARQKTFKALCSNYLRQMTFATTSYAYDYKRNLPPRLVYWYAPHVGHPTFKHGFYLVYQTGYNPNVKALFCPQHNINPSTHWPVIANGNYVMSYPQREEASTPVKIGNSKKYKTTSLPSSAAFYSDLFMGGGGILSFGPHQTGWNVAKIDGSCRFVNRTPDIIANIGTNTGLPLNTFQAQEKTWQRFDQE